VATINSTAANNFCNHITQQYDRLFPAQLAIDSMTADEDQSEDPILQKAQEYRRMSDMTSWYQAVDALPSLHRNHFFSGAREQRNLEISALQFSALERLKALNVESTYLIPFIAKIFPPAGSFISISNPKSELDSLIFREVFRQASHEELNRILELMEATCQNLDPKFFNTDHLIYRIQEVGAFVLGHSIIRQVACGILIIAPIVGVFYVTNRIYTAFIKALTARWETVVNQNPDGQLVSGVNIVYRKLKAFNDFTTKTELSSMISGQALPRIIGYSAALSGYFPPMLTTAYWIVYPKTGFNWCAMRFITSNMLKPALVALKIFNGTEHQTIQVLKERFKKDPVNCEKALKAHALWMHLQRKGTPEECLTLMGYLPAPAA
jgi:hypothetical protein